MDQISIVDTGYESYEYEQNRFAEKGYKLIIFKGDPKDRENLIEFAGESVGILVRGTPVDGALLDAMPRLRAIVRYGTGFDNIDLRAAFQKGIRVANVQGYANHAVSDHAMALMFACTRGFGSYPPDAFGKPFRKEVMELHDKTLGIIGIGRIGSHFSRKASPLFSRTLACDPYQTGEYMKKEGAVKCELPELLAGCHVISIHCSLTPETSHMLNEPAFGMMEQKPVIINTARGPVIDEGALLKALHAGRVHSAGLDVFEVEPHGYTEDRLIDHPYVIATPHVAWYSSSSMKELQKRATDNLLSLLLGRSIPDEIIPQ